MDGIVIDGISLPSDFIANTPGSSKFVDNYHHIVAHGDYVNHKPAPDPYLRATHFLKVHPSLCVALEDSPKGVQSASSAGMMTIMVPDLLEPTDEVRALCAFVVDDLHAVHRLASIIE
jgi:beta-phosphoglucomutase-like phosphatase (HAD superfamily)